MSTTPNGCSTTAPASGWMWKYAEMVLAAVFLVTVTVVFMVIGGNGSKATLGTSHDMYMCVVQMAETHIWDPFSSMIDDQSCLDTGRPFVLVEEDSKMLPHYPLKNIMLYSYIPYLKKHVMSKEFEFLLMDIGLQFMFSSYVKEFMDEGMNVLKFQVALGYRDSVKGPWKRMAAGNVTRTLNCRQSKTTRDILSCDNLPLLELGSCHHKQYLINLFFPELPLSNRKEYKGLSQLTHVDLFEIHQSPSFTRLWIHLKTILFPVTLVVVLLFWNRLLMVVKMERRSISLVEKFLGYLGCCLVFYNVPFRYLSLYYDCPWLLVLNDFRQGLFIAALFSFWIIFVAEHNPDKDVNSHLGCYWKQMGVVAVASISLFVYEFCERGIQVMFPFYSLWGSKFGIAIAYAFVGAAMASALVYLAILLVTVYKVLRDLRKKQNELLSLSPVLRPNVTNMFNGLRFFLVLTLLVAVCSIVTAVLPAEVLLHHLQHDQNEYNIYSGILTGNYGMWNAYCLIMLYIYAPVVSKTTSGKEQSAPVTDQISLQELIVKKSQN